MEIAAFVFSAVSLALAIISFIISIKAQHLQNKVNAMELKLKQYELAEKEKEQAHVSCVEARINNIMKNKYRIKVWNSGNTIAKDIKVSWEPAEGILCFDTDKLPFDELEANKSFELAFSLYSGAPSKIYITTEWEDEKGEKQSKKQLCDI